MDSFIMVAALDVDGQIRKVGSTSIYLAHFVAAAFIVISDVVYVDLGGTGCGGCVSSDRQVFITAAPGGLMGSSCP
jgi:hypothetical protein